MGRRDSGDWRASANEGIALAPRFGRDVAEFWLVRMGQGDVPTAREVAEYWGDGIPAEADPSAAAATAAFAQAEGAWGHSRDPRSG